MTILLLLGWRVYDAVTKKRYPTKRCTVY